MSDFRMKSLVDAAQNALDEKIIYEPRGYFNVLPYIQSTQRYSIAEEAYRNGEQFPVTLTHATIFTTNLSVFGGVDERNIQEVGLRMTYHNQQYMNDEFLPCPLWMNKVTATADPTGFISQSWDLTEMTEKPFVMMHGDTVEFDVFGVADAADEPLLVSVSMRGIGMLSYRDRMFTGEAVVPAGTQDGVRTRLPTNNYRNDGSEPILITEITLNYFDSEVELQPDVQEGRVFLQARRVGSGTNANWFSGPKTPIDLSALAPGVFDFRIDGMLAALMGVSTGRAIVHRFPEPWVWQPGDGLDEVAIAPTVTSPTIAQAIHVALTGYITIV